ncbi:uncharacterized protein A4U43_C08F14920 [Asparagus officinalis]|nr:uncharacterized protein A4U43_C08F14920 [Asparagus officinalis]
MCNSNYEFVVPVAREQYLISKALAQKPASSNLYSTDPEPIYEGANPYSSVVQGPEYNYKTIKLLKQGAHRENGDLQLLRGDVDRRDTNSQAHPTRWQATRIRPTSQILARAAAKGPVRVRLGRDGVQRVCVGDGRQRASTDGPAILPSPEVDAEAALARRGGGRASRPCRPLHCMQAPIGRSLGAMSVGQPRGPLAMATEG